MKTFLALITGAVIGGYVVSKLTPDQRRDAAQAATKAASKARSTQVGEAIVDGVSHISEAAGERVSSVVSASSEAIADTVAPDGSNGAQPHGATTRSS
jgi:surface antigen